MTADRTARLAAIRERCEKATPGPWTGTVHDYSMAQIHSENPDIWAAEHSPIICVSPCGACQGREEEAAKREGREPAWQWGRCTCPTKEDFDFLISSRADIPFLLADNARLEAELAASEARVREARKVGIEEAAKVADLYAETNLQIAGDTVLADPAFKPGPKDWKKSEDLMIKGCIASSMFHAAQNIAEAIRNLAQEGETK